MNPWRFVFIAISTALVGLFVAFVAATPFVYIASNYSQSPNLDNFLGAGCAAWIAGFVAGCVYTSILFFNKDLHE